MNKLKHILIFIAATAIISTSCTCKRSIPEKESSVDYVKEGFIKAKVIKYTLDGCSFMIELENGNKLEPKNLPESFQKNDILVWIKYIQSKNTMSICMAGKPVNITSIELRKE